MHRTKNGWQLLSVFISSSKDFLNCEPNVCERFLVSFIYNHQTENISDEDISKKKIKESKDDTVLYISSFTQTQQNME